MIIKGSKLIAADNSGAKILRCIEVSGGTRKRWAGIGEEIVVSVIQISTKSNVKKGSVHRAIIVRTKKEKMRSDGSRIRFDDNAAVLLNSSGDPLGTRVFGIMPRELRYTGSGRLISLASEVQ